MRYQNEQVLVKPKQKRHRNLTLEDKFKMLDEYLKPSKEEKRV